MKTSIVRMTGPLIWMWAALVAAMLAPAMAGRLTAALRAIQEAGHVPVAAVVLANAREGIATLLLAAVMLVSLWQAGLRLWGWIGSRYHKPDSFRHWTGMFIGGGAISMALFGLLLVRLWFPAVLITAWIVMAVALRGRSSLRGVRIMNLAGWRPWVRRWWGPVSAFAPWGIWLFVPETHEDAWTYHLAAPQRWLDLHGLALDHSDVSLHFPMLAEVLHAIPLAFGLDAVPRWISMAGYVAGCGALISVIRPVDPRLAWLALATAASTAVFVTAKCDGWNTGLVLAALAAALARSSAAAIGVLAGLALSTKASAGLNLAWIPLTAWLTGRRYRWGWWASAGTTAVAVWGAWLLKSFLLTGDPVYPALTPGLPPVITAGAGGLRLAEFGSGWIRDHVALAWIAPIALLGGIHGTRAALPPLAIYGVWFFMFPGPHTARWGYPALAAAGCLLVAGAVPPPVRRIFIVMCLLAGIHRFADSLTSAGMTPDPFSYLIGAESRAKHVARGLGTVAESRDVLNRERRPGAILMIGEWHQYGMPQPVLLAGPDLRASPTMLHNLIAASPDDRTLLRTFRQLDLHTILYNPTRALNAAHVQESVLWTDAELARWRSCFVGRFRLLHVPERMDTRQGVIYLYRRGAQRIADGKPLAHLPGTETLFGQALARVYAGRTEEGLQLARAASARTGPVLTYLNTTGTFAFMTGRYAEAAAEFAPGISARFLDGENYFLAGLSAFRTGRMLHAADLLEQSAAFNPHRANDAMRYAVRAHMALWLDQIGRNPDRARRHAQDALGLIDAASAAMDDRMLRIIGQGAHLVALRKLGRDLEAGSVQHSVEVIRPELTRLSIPALETWVRDRLRELNERNP